MMRKRFLKTGIFFFSLVVLFIAVPAFSGFFLPLESKKNDFIFVDERENDGVITVMTLNMRHGRGMDGVVQLDEIAKLIKMSGADIVALQEVDRYLLRSGHVDQVKWLGEELGMVWRYAPTIRLGSIQYGNAVLSKYPLLSSEVITLPGKLENRNVMRVTVSLNEQPWLVYNTHLGIGEDEREDQFSQVLKAVTNPTQESFAVLLGDFNMEVSHDLFLHLPEEWSWVEVDEPTLIDGSQVDHVFVSPLMHVVDARVIATEASDHAPVVVRLRSE